MKLVDLDAKIKAAEEKVAKCKKTIERHNTQLDKKTIALNKLGINFEDYKDFWEFKRAYVENDNWHEVATAYQDVEQKYDDIKCATNKLADAERILDNWKSKYNAQKSTEQFINNEIPQVIVDFLEKWKKDTIEFTKKQYEDFRELRNSFNAEAKELIKLAEKDCGHILSYHEQNQLLADNELDKDSFNQQCAIRFGSNGFLTLCISRGLSCLENEVEREKQLKLVDLMNRVKALTGPITDAELTVEYGDLNGIVYGENGNASVKTIGAGGYNIQRFHFRVLVRKV